MSDQDKSFTGVVMVMVANPYGESEGDGVSGLFLDASTRQRFIFKVYKVLTLQWISVILLTGVFLFLAHQFRWIPVHPAILALLSIFLFPVACCSISCCFKEAKRVSPGNLKFVVLFTLVGAISATTALFESKTRDLPVFAGITLVILLCLTLLTLQNKLEFSKVLGLLVVIPVGLTLTVLNFVYLEEMNWELNACVTSLFSVAFCSILVWETQKVVQIGGKHELTSQDVIFVALKLHLYMFSMCYAVFFLPVYIYLMMGALNPELLHRYCAAQPEVEDGTTRVRKTKLDKALKVLASLICKNYGV